MKYAGYFNFNNFRDAVIINSIPCEISYPTKNYILDDFGGADGDGGSNIYFTPHGYGNYLIYSSEGIYLNANCVKIAKDLTKLEQCCLFNTHLFNYKYVTNMHTAFVNCYNLNVKPIAPRNVNSMYGTYYGCYNITGTPKIGANTQNLIATYYNCYNLTEELPENINVVAMVGTFYNCYGIESSPPLEVSAITLYDCFYNCTNLSGHPANCNNAFITINAYYQCPNIYGDFYWLFNGFHQASKVNMTNMFYGRNYDNLLTMYVYENYAIANALINYSAQRGNIYGTGAIDWVEVGTGLYYNQTYNTQVRLLPDHYPN